MSINFRKVAVIGTGFVGSSSAFALMQSGLFSEMVLVDVMKDKAEGEAMDINHGAALCNPMNIYAGDYADIKDAAIIILTAGANQKPGETRLDLLKKNIAIHSSIMAEIRKQNCEGILLVVANPVDVLTLYAQKHSGMPENRVFGSGTVLDTARLRYLIGNKLDVDARSVHAYVIGEHGDSEIVTWSNANVSGVPLADFFALRGMQGSLDLETAQKDIADDVKNAAYKIIERKHATYYGIAASVVRICRAVLKDEKSILPISTGLHGEYGIDDVSLSVPAIVGRNGVEELVPILLSEQERDDLSKSASVLKKSLEELDM
ncbi:MULTISPECIES: L-lactate dehydrogenase [Terrabacteria group]|uniref:L-lactate dehydrogenase n=1 Tax=Bacillati TaxID=1783272 RepID=UPI001939841F|nr:MULTISPECIES: L-lactate dehydrogenase [Terrabacteria group]MBW9212203.1 L-lactate dehydrogenase [Trueperella sp. zg.1013]QRG86252.1 L-lactate dehydrogenase [Bulleidia sp. zg-1006]